MTHPTSPLQQQALRNTLQVSADLLHRRRASEIPEGYIDAYVRLDWLEWRGGGLRLTPLGHEICLEGLEQG